MPEHQDQRNLQHRNPAQRNQQQGKRRAEWRIFFAATVTDQIASTWHRHRRTDRGSKTGNKDAESSLVGRFQTVF